jgi:hypothetical protein
MLKLYTNRQPFVNPPVPWPYPTPKRGRHAHVFNSAFRISREDNITSAALGFLNAYGIQATSQTNSRGHVDIYLKHAWQPRLAICGEAKIWRGAAHHIGGLAQVLG